MNGFTIFEFDILQPLIAQLRSRLDGLETAQLTPSMIDTIPPNAQGVYELFVGGRLKYVGKSDAGAGLRTRLLRHSRKMQHRTGLDPLDVHFKAAQVPVFSVMDLETELIGSYRRDRQVFLWNGSGFGSNDPGRNRDNSSPGTFDQEYPINIDIPIPMSELSLVVGMIPASVILRQLSKYLPYTLRVESTRVAKDRLQGTEIAVSDNNLTVREVMSLVSKRFPGWQATLFKSHVIFYHEDVRYQFGQII